MKRERETYDEVVCYPWDTVNGYVYTRRGTTDWRGLYTTYVHDHIAALQFKTHWKRRCRVSLELWPPSSGITSHGWMDSSTGTYIAPPFWWCIDCPHEDCKPTPIVPIPTRTDRVHLSPTSPLVGLMRIDEPHAPLPLDIQTVRTCESVFDTLYQHWRAAHHKALTDGIVLFQHYWSLDDNGAYLRWWQEWSGNSIAWK